MGCSRIRCARLLAVGLAAVMVFACGSKKKKDETASTPDQAAQTNVAYPGALPIPQTKDGIVAKVEGHEIPVRDIVGELQRLHGQLSQRVPPEEQPKMEPMLQHQAIENAVNRTLLILQSEREGITVPDPDVEKEFANFRSQFPDSATFVQQMQTASLDEKTVKQRLRENLIINKVIEKHTANAAAATPQEVDQFYKENPDQFRVPEQVRASHILVRSSPTDPPETRGARKATADSILGALKHGADFAKTAEGHSEDPSSAARGGDLNFFARGQMVPAFEAVAFSLGVGQMSGVVETQFGYHILKVTDKKAPSTVPLDQVRKQVTDFLTNRHKASTLQDWVTQLRSQAKVEVADSTGKFQPLPPPKPQAMGEVPAGSGGGGQ